MGQMSRRPTPEVLDAFVEMELRNLPRADEYHSRFYEWTIKEGTTFRANGRNLTFPKDVRTMYISQTPVAGLPIRLWYRNVAPNHKTG